MNIDPSLVPPLVRLDLYEVPRRMMDAVIRCDVEQFVDCFSPDGCWDAEPLVPLANGRDEIRQRLTDAWKMLRWVFQGHFHTVVVSYSENRAQLRTYLYEVGVTKVEGPVPVGLGCYTDDVELIDGRWKVTKHGLSMIYFGDVDFQRPIFEHPQR